MKMKMPFDGFYLKLLDEQNGTHEYEEYLRNCKENPLTEEEQREWTESARAAIAELEQLNAEPEPTRQAAEPEVEAEGTSSPQTPEPAELQEGCCAVQEAEEVLEVEVVPAEAIVPLGQTGEDAPAEKERWAKLMESYFQEEADRITTGVLIVDIRHKPTANDLVMHDWFRQTGCPEIVVANKLDKLKKSQVEPALQLVRETLELTEADILLPFSAEKGMGKEDLIRLLVQTCGG